MAYADFRTIPLPISWPKDQDRDFRGHALPVAPLPRRGLPRPHVLMVRRPGGSQRLLDVLPKVLVPRWTTALKLRAQFAEHVLF